MNQRASLPTTLFATPGGWRIFAPAAVVAMAAVLTGFIVWMPTQSAALTGGFVGAGLLAAAVLWALRLRTVAVAPALAEVSDWSLVRSVADMDHSGIAITDRTGRLVCANDLY